MNTHTYLRRLAACSVLLVGVGSLSATSSVAAAPDGAPAASAARAADPSGTTYLYQGRFSGTLTHHQLVDWGSPDYDKRDVTIGLSGTFPKISVDQRGIMSLLDPLSTTVDVGAVDAKSVISTNSGHLVQTCVGTSAEVGGQPSMMYDPLSDETDVHLFSYINVPTNCTYNTNAPPGTRSYGYPLYYEGVDLKPSEVGTGPLTVSLSGTYLPHSCPGYIEGQTPKCEYGFAGDLVLTFVEKVLPQDKPADPTPPTKDPKKVTIAPGAKQITTGVLCPKKCRVEIAVFGLKHALKLAPPKVVKAKPGRTVKVKVTIPSRKRALVKKAGGVRVKLTYRLASGKKYTEVRKARL